MLLRVLDWSNDSTLPGGGEGVNTPIPAYICKGPHWESRIYHGDFHISSSVSLLGFFFSSRPVIASSQQHEWFIEMSDQFEFRVVTVPTSLFPDFPSATDQCSSSEFFTELLGFLDEFI